MTKDSKWTRILRRTLNLVAKIMPGAFDEGLGERRPEESNLGYSLRLPILLLFALWLAFLVTAPFFGMETEMTWDILRFWLLALVPVVLIAAYIDVKNRR